MSLTAWPEMKNYHSSFKRQLSSCTGFPNRAVALSGAEVTYNKWVKEHWVLKALKLEITIMKSLVIAEVLINCRCWSEVNHSRGWGNYPWDQNGWSLTFLDNCHVGEFAEYNLSSTVNRVCLWLIHTELTGSPLLQNVPFPELSGCFLSSDCFRLY